MNLLFHFIKNPISFFYYILLGSRYRYSLKVLLKNNVKDASVISRKIIKGKEEAIFFEYKGDKIWMRNEVGAVYYMTEGVKNLEKLVNKIDLPPCSTVIDAGGNVGLFTFFLKQRFPDAKVIVIEPSKSLISILKKNLAQWEKDIKIVPKALTSKTGIVTFYINKKSEQTNSINLNVVTPFIDTQDDIITYDVPSINLESLIEENQLSKIDLLKLDIQGGEFPVIESAVSQFEKIDALVVEVSFISKDSIALCHLLTEHFKKSKILGEVKMGADILFLK